MKFFYELVNNPLYIKGKLPEKLKNVNRVVKHIYKLYKYKNPIDKEFLIPIS